MNKVKALYGMWSHCMYSCDVLTFESYTKANKPLPMAKFDKYYNKLEPVNPYEKVEAVTMRSDAQPQSQSQLSQSVTFPRIANGTTLVRAQTDVMNRWSLQHSPLHSQTTEVTNEDSDVASNHRFSSPPLSNVSNFSVSSHVLHATSSSSNFSNNMDLDELWTINPMPPYSAEKYYNFSYYTMSMNELKKGMEKVIAPTDSRFRPDVRRLEYGDIDGASREKSRLEEKQREARRNLVGEYKPKWFYYGTDPKSGEKMWLYNGKYFQRDFSDCPDLF